MVKYLQPIPYEFLINEENFVFFFISVPLPRRCGGSDLWVPAGSAVSNTEEGGQVLVRE